MKTALAVRIYKKLLRRLVPSLRPDYLEDAAETFQTLHEEARTQGMVAVARFLLRESGSLARTVWASRFGRGSGATDPGEEPPVPSEMGTGGLGRWLDAGTLDLRFAFRSLARTPGFTVVAVASLTFGIAASSVLFTIVNGVFFRPLPHAEDPGSLVHVFSGFSQSSRGPISFPDFEDLRETTSTLSDVAVERDRHFYVGSASEGSRRVWGVEVSENYFDLLGIPMARGRGFLTEDIAQGRSVAVIGYGLWNQRFGGDPGVIGREILVDGQPHVVVGVGPEGMVSPDGPALLELAVPTQEVRSDRGFQAFTAVGRLRDGVGVSQVQAELDGFALAMAEAHPESWVYPGTPPRGLHVLTPRQAQVPDASAFWLAVAGFLGAVGLILLITCSNVANLLLTRAFRRRGEIAVRAAIGARGRRIVGQLLTENFLLFGAAGAASLLLIQGALSAIRAGWFGLPPVGVRFDLDVRVVAFTLGLTVLSGMTFGLLPAVQASRPDLVSALKGRSKAVRFRRLGVRNLLVGIQVGGSAVFVMVTLLLLQSLSHARSMDLGFEDQGVALVSMDLEHRNLDEEGGRSFIERLKDDLETIPGVEGAEVSSWVPLEGGSTHLGGLMPEGFGAGPEDAVSATMSSVTPGYLDLLGIEVLRGRPLGPDDRNGGELVAVVSQAFVDTYWPGEGGVGRVILREDRDPITVVGVAEDVPMRTLGADPAPHLWLPFDQWYQSDIDVHVRTAQDPREILPSVRLRVADADPDLPILRLDLMENVTANGTLPQRILSLIMAIAGGVALSLAVLGIYGVVSFSVSQRTREVGLRIALGAEPRTVVGSVIKEAFGVAVVGLVPGFVLSLAAARLLTAFLLGADPMNPSAFGAGFALLAAAVVVASLAPAVRASRCQPMESLRAD